MTASTVTRSGFRSDPTAPLPQSPPARSVPKPETAPKPAASAPKPAASGLKPVVTTSSAPAAEPLLPPVTAEEEAEGGFGVFLKQQTASAAVAATAPPPPDPEPEPEPPVAAEPVLERELPPAPEATPAPKSPSPLAKLVQAPSTGAELSAPPPPEEPAGDLLVSTAAKAPPERRAQSNSPPPTSAPAPMTASTLQKMKDQGLYRNQYFKDAECFECAHRFKVSRSSRSATCPSCGATIPMEDVEINMPSDQKIRTRGDVLIRKRGHLVTDTIVCKDLRCYGTIEANVDAAGDAIFRSTGTVIGDIRCKRLIIEKGCDVTFQSPVHANEVEIHARVTGSLVSSGLILIGANGCANGDVTARSVSIEPGGELNGAMNIVRASKPKPKAILADPPAEEEPSLPVA